MTKDKSKIRHDFINNGLRLELLHNMIIESLEKKTEINPEYLDDLENFLKEQVELTKEIKEFF